MFWADARMIIDYGQFGDVLSFDTTYKINKENQPFAMFVGLNHHRETVIFGGALMYDETIDSFVWLFETFLQAMSGKAPKTIFIDQDAAMAKAILNVMPTTYHRLCTWHMMQNALKHVHGVFSSEVKSVLSQFFYEIEEESDFLMAWNHMLDEYNVHENTWLKSIFDLKEKWAYTYVRHAWSAGMKSTQLSESFNATLKEYLKSDLNVAQFFMHFERVINDKRYKELEAEYDLLYRLVNVKINAKMLIQAREVYTKAIFLEFQHEFEQAVELNMNCETIGGNIVYSVNMDCASKERHVKKDSDNILTCSCRMFEIKGVLCSHVIKILRDGLNIKEIPTQYILKRWTKQARVECVQDMHGREIEEDPKLQQTCRYRSLCSIFTRLSSRASESEKAYILVNEHASNLTKLVEDILHIEMAGNNHDKDHGSQTVVVEMDCAQDSNIVKAKGLKKKETSRGRRRIKSSLEKALAKKKKHTKAHIQSHPTVNEIHYPPMVYSPYTSEPHLQGCNIASTSMPWIPFEQSQPRGFQELLQQNSSGFSFEFQDSQASNK